MTINLLLFICILQNITMSVKRFFLGQFGNVKIFFAIAGISLASCFLSFHFSNKSRSDSIRANLRFAPGPGRPPEGDRNGPHGVSHVNVSENRPNEVCYKQVHIWTERVHWAVGTDFDCPGLPCKLRQVEDASIETMKKSDAVLFHDLSFWDWDEVIRNKPPGQKWIFKSSESPVNTRRGIVPPKEYHNNSYDYIMSYRRYEDNIFGDFGRYDTKEPWVSPDDKRNWAEGKTRLAVWVARNCDSEYLHWRRTEFVRALSTVAQVGMYGPCGDEECPRDNMTCIRKIESHKFYLALENCKCRNYITEKVWENSFNRKLVPVVFGPPKADYELVLPPHSFIFVEDFKNMRELADFLLLIDSRDDLYNEYHAWRKVGKTKSIQEGQLLNPKMMCQVVERLLRDEEAVKAGTYKRVPPPDWESWWFGSCTPDKGFPIPID